MTLHALTDDGYLRPQGRAWWQWPRPWARQVGGGTGNLRLDDAGMAVDHPALPQPLVVPWEGVRSFSVEVVGVNSFPVYRFPGGHPLDEPWSFLDRHATRRFEDVPLLQLSIGLGVPNVAILFWQVELDCWAPDTAEDRGWVPLESRMTGRHGPSPPELRRLHPAGIYLEAVRPEQVRDDLVAHGVKEGFDCTDWVHATGAEHPGLSA